MTDRDARLDRLSPAKRRLLEQRLARRVAGPIPAVKPAGPGDFRAGFAQERFWFLERFDPGHPAHHIPSRSRIVGELDEDAFIAALLRVARRHEVLRTTFHMLGGELVQRVHADCSVTCPKIDLRHHEDPDERRRELFEQVTRRPFDLQTGPLWRLALLRTGDDAYELLSCLHHAVADGLSIPVMAREILEGYAARLENRPARVAPLQVQMRDCTAWQRSRLAAGDLDADVAWWRAKLADLTPLEIPREPLLDVPAGRGCQRLAHALDQELGERLLRFARETAVTPFSVLLAAWQVLLHRASGASDLAVGTLVSGRDQRATRDLIGLFMNSVVLRSRLDPELGFRQLARLAQATTTEALAHAEVPFERLVEELGPARDPERHPLFQVLLNLVDFVDLEETLPGARMQHERLPSGTELDLALTVVRKGGAFTLELEWDPGRFSEALVKHWLASLACLLEDALERPDVAAADLRLAGMEARARAEERLCAPPVAGGPLPRIDERLADLAREQPDAVALRHGERIATRSELDRQAGAIASALREAGREPRLVALLLPRGPRLVAALVACARAGAAWLPLDPDWPVRRIRQVLEDAGPDLLLVEGSDSPQVTVAGLDVLDVADLPVEAAPPPPPRRADAAYLIYTSGSAGRPKGVRITHASLSNLLQAMAARPGLDVSDGMLALTTVSFDISLVELLLPLWCGARVILADSRAVGDPQRLAQLLAQPDVSVAQATPSTWRLLQAAGWRGRPGLRLWSGGEALPRDLADDLASWCAEAWNLYGPTETTVWSTAWRVGPGPVDLGRPLRGTRLAVLDRSGRALPAAFPGELCIAGAGVALGYLRRPELEDARFVADPDEAARRRYRTGDRVRLLPGGTLQYLGRLDTQLKLRGWRVAPEEVEAVLRAHPDVRDAAVAAVRHASSAGAPVLAAWWTGAVEDGDDARAGGELLAWCAARLPRVLVPGRIVRVSSLPRTPAGKLDRRALRLPAEAPPAEVRDPTGLAAVRELFRDVLGTAAVADEDDFFALGGHSLLAAHLLARLRTALGAEVPLRAFFEEPTVAGLARRLALSGPEPDTRVPRLAQRTGEFPVSSLQRRLWFLEHLTPGTCAWNVPVALHLAGPLDVEALKRAFEALVRRHAILRTTFPARDGVPVQRVSEAVVAHLACEAGPLDESQVQHRLELLANEPFDVEHGPLLRAALFAMKPDSHVLLLVQHHLVTDARSQQLLGAELARNYARIQAGEDPDQEPGPLQFADFAAWAAAREDAAEHARLAAWWRGRLQDLPPPLELPGSKQRPPLFTHAGNTIELQLEEPLGQALRDRAAELRTTPFCILVAGTAGLLARLGDQDDLVIGTSSACRTHTELESLPGPFVNTLPLRLHCDRARSFADLVQQAHDVVSGALAHQELPFEHIVAASEAPRDLSRPPLFPVSVDQLDAAWSAPLFPGLDTRPRFVPLRAARSDLGLRFLGNPPDTVHLEYANTLYSEEDARRFFSRLEALLAAALRDPARGLRRLPVIEDTLHERLARGLRGSEAALDPDRGVQHLIHDRALESPEAPALRHASGTWSRRRLQQEAARVACALRAARIPEDSVVAVAAPRSPELVAAMLGILQAGAAFLVLDPAHPARRNAFILRDSGATLLLHAADTGDLPDAPRRLALGALPGAPEVIAAPLPVDAEAPACVHYTSGTTGRPRGLVIPHGALSNYVTWAARTYRPGDGDGAPLHGSLAYDLALTGLLPPLVSGAAVHVLPHDAGLQELLDGCGREQPFGLVKITPSHLRALAAEASPGALAGWTRVLVVGGEALDAADLEILRRHAPATRIFNEYGPTEATVGCCVHEVRGDEREGSIPIGTPVQNVTLHVLDRHGDLAPPGTPGELGIAGRCLAASLAPEDGSDRFGPHPFQPGARMLRSGDRVRQLAGGSLEFLGRLDDQLKIRGFRVEPAEVERALLALPGVREAAVLARPHPVGGPRLWAWVAGAGLVPESLLESLAAELPQPLLPSGISVQAELPRTPNGKLDRARLRAPDDLHARAAASGQGDERLVADIFAALLEVAEVGRDDDFFALGGDSILSLRVVARARRAGLNLDTRTIFRERTPARIAAAARRDVAMTISAEPAPPGSVLPLGDAQQAFFDLDLQAPAHWNQALLCDLHPGVEPIHVVQALQALVRHHEALRLSFVRTGDGWRQVTGGGDLQVMEIVDGSGWLPGQEQRLLGSLARRAHAGLDLQRGPLLRAVLVERGVAAGARLLLVAHHLLVDAASWHVLADDLESALSALVQERPVRLDPATPYSAVVTGRAPRPAGNDARASRPTTTLAPFLDGLEHAGIERMRRDLTRSLDADTTRRLQAALAGAGLRRDELLAAALAHARGTLAGPGRVGIDVERHGREQREGLPDLTRCVGWLARTDRVELDTTGAQDLQELLQHVRDSDEGSPGRESRAALLLNDLGRVTAAGAAGGPLRAVRPGPGPDRAEENACTHALEVRVREEDGVLRVTFLHRAGDQAARSVQLLADQVMADLMAFADSSAAASREDWFPLSPTQQGMLFHTLLQPDSEAYREQILTLLAGPLDVEALRGAWRAAARECDTLRLRVAWRGREQPLQSVTEDLPEEFRVHDWREVVPENEDARLDAFMAGDRARGFDLERGPLYRHHLFRLAGGRHGLLFSFHHLVLDGWSLPLLIERVMGHYARLLAGEAPVLEPATSWRDFVEWLGTRDRASEERFWRAELQGFDLPTPLPGDTAQDGAADHEEQELVLGDEDTEEILGAARAAGVTLGVLVQAAWALVLGRCTGTEDVVFGLTVSGRPENLPGAERRIGLFINTLPVRVTLPAGTSVGTWLRALQDRHAQRLRWQHTPLLVSQGCAAAPPRRPLFETLLVFENYPVDVDTLQGPGGLAFRGARSFERTSYPLTLVAVPPRTGLDDRLVLRTLHDPGRVPAGSARALLERLVSALRALARGADDLLDDLEVMPPQERESLLSLCRAAPPGPAPAVMETIGRLAGEHPGAPALVSGEGTWSRSELLAAAHAVAGRLAPHVTLPDTLVATCLPRSRELIASLLGVLQSGAAWLPLDPDWPAARLQRILQDSGARVLLAPADATPRLPAFQGTRLDPLGGPEPARSAAREARTTDLAYVMHTSGTTGSPRGVAVERGALDHFIAAALPAYGLTADDRVLQFASCAFDACLEEILGALASGATLVLRPAGMLASPGHFLRVAARLALTVLDLPTAWFHELLRDERLLAEELPAGLRLVILGGETLAPEAARAWRRVAGQRVRLVNSYGPTEATVVATLADLEAWTGEGAVPVGRPLSGCEAWVLDARGRLLPRGATGELCLAGPQLARGYLQGEAATHQRFVASPLCGTGRLYRTGDRARMAADGTLFLCGRLDDQVKVRGQRVEPAEVEQALRAHAAVAACAVRGIRRGGSLELAAWIVAQAGATPDPADLRAWLARELPPAWLPARWAVVSALPRNAAGKLDARALPEPRPIHAAGRAASLATSDERTVAELFAEVLDVPRVGVHDDFFALGGHSLTSLRLLVRIEEVTGIQLPLEAVFDSPSPAALTARLASGTRASCVDDLLHEVRLPADVTPPAETAVVQPPADVLLTGATGFLGAHLLEELLQRSAARVHLLVRARTEQAALDRLADTRRRYEIPESLPPERIRVVTGDLAAPGLGLSAAAFDGLARNMDLILHAGAAVGFFRPYASLKPANVDGTLELLRLACRGDGTPLHHVSTIGVLDAAVPQETVDESADLRAFAGVEGGYAQTKWVAEMLVLAAAARGLPVTVHRPGRIVAHARTGAWNPDDVAQRFLAGCLALGAGPDVQTALDLTPVDFVARAIIGLALDPASSGGTFHLMCREPRPVAGLFAELAAQGQVLRPLPPQEWLALLRERASDDPAHPLRPLLPALLGHVPGLSDLLHPGRGPRVRADRTLDHLERLGIKEPPPVAP